MTCLSSHRMRGRQAPGTAVCLSGRCSFCHPRLQPQRARQDQGGGGFTRGEALHIFPGKKNLYKPPRFCFVFVFVTTTVLCTPFFLLNKDCVCWALWSPSPSGGGTRGLKASACPNQERLEPGWWVQGPACPASGSRLQLRCGIRNLGL